MGAEGVKNIAVIGAGLMGHGIALEFASAGYHVRINDRSPELLEAALERARTGMDALAKAGRIGTSEVEPALARLHTCADLAEAAQDADVVVEAVFENLALKQEIFAALDRVAPAHAILLSNTSTYLPSALASATKRPDRVAVAHYFNPPHLLPIVELVRGPETSDETMETARDLLVRAGKKPAIVNREILGFIGNRLQNALFREALALVQNGVATAEDVDTVVKYGFGRRLAVAGPFEVWEQIGWDLVSVIAGELFRDIEDTKDLPRVLTEKVESGDLGTKTGRGFYEWPEGAAEALRQRMAKALMEMSRWDI
ncbi:MAG: 3-hydroxyacyl-CoA dehydrogenase family protein [Dehalococcoidia bacterium]